MLVRSLTASAMIAFTVAAGGTASPAADGPANGRIAFSLYGVPIVTNPDGTGQWPLSPASGWEPGDWSPDGTRLAIVRDGEIYLADPRGRVRVRSTYAPPNRNPSFSPDGSKIAFESGRGRGIQIYVMNVDGSAQRPITAIEGPPALDPEWSPDGTQIAWTAFRDGSAEIFVTNADGTQLRRLTNHPGVDQSPSWSPDGTRIAFASSRDGSLDIFTMGVDGTDVRQLTTSPAMDTAPEWSPEGRTIAFMSERSGQPALFAMDASGEKQRQLSVIADTTSGPAWQPLPREPLKETIRGPHCTIWGTPADDLLVGTSGRDVVCGLEGDDRILGGEGGDTLVGEAGRDSIVGGPGRDIVAAGAGDDLVDVRDGELDSVEGGPDRDTVLVDRGMEYTLGAEREFDPDPRNLTRGRPVCTSSTVPTGPAEYAVDGHTRLLWGSGDYAPQWIEADIGRYATVGRIQLVVAQYPDWTDAPRRSR